MTAPTPAQIQSYIEGRVKFAGAADRDGWRKIHCPNDNAHAHGDRNASAAVNVNSGHIECHACGLKGLVGKIYGDLGWPSPPWNGNGHKQEFNIVAAYDYRMAAGELSYQVVRLDPKDFKQRRPDGNSGWIWGTKGLKRLPYNLPELATAEYVFIVEGEKDVEALRNIGQIATCNTGGACKWTEELNQYFTPNHHITILPDNDTPGRDHATQVAQNLFGKVASLKVLELAGLPEKGDVSDWLIGRDSETAAEELCRLADAAPEWKPGEAEKPAGFQPPEHWHMLDFSNVREWECTPLQPIIKDLGIFKGTFILLAAMSQAGKTLLILYLIRRMIAGGLCFGRFTVDTIKKLLYFVLEDPDRRIKARWMDHAEPDIEPGRAIPYIAPGFKLNDDACFSHLEDLIKTGGFEVVILDTYQKATPGISSFNDEQQSIILHKLAELTRKYNVTIIVLDHIRKGDSGKRRKEISLEDIKGTGGKAQNADTVILLERTGGKLKFTATSKDLDAPVGFLLDVAPQGSTGEKFAYAGDLEELIGAQKQKGKENRERILQAIGDDWSTREDIERRVSLGRSTVAKHLTKLFDEGLLEKKGNARAICYRKSSVRDERELWTKI